MQPEHLPQPDRDLEEVGPGEKVVITWAEWRQILYNWMLMLAGLGVIYGVGYWIAP